MKKKVWMGAAVALAMLILVLGLFLYIIGHQVRGQYFDSAGVKIYYTDQGAGVPVILVHGYMANADVNWRLPGVLSKLRKHFRVIAMDVRGHGLSDKPHDASKYGIEMVNDVQRLMDHLKIAKAHLVGYSMGGFITLKFAATHQDRLISAMPCGAAWMTPSDPMCNLLIEIHKGMMGEGPRSSRVGSMKNVLRRSVLRTVMDLEALGCVAERFKELAVTEAELRAITVPIMAVRGGRDEVVVGGGDLKTALPGFQQTIIPGARHNRVIFYPGFYAAIADFLKTHSSVLR
jgi:pimeloyl-ACP methyl ester carboxylesterase